MKFFVFVLLIITNCYGCGSDEKRPDLYFNGQKFDYYMIDGQTAKVDISKVDISKVGIMNLTDYEPYDLYIVFNVETREEIDAEYTYFLQPDDFLAGYYFK